MSRPGGLHLNGEATDELAGVHVVYVKVVAAPPAHAPSPPALLLLIVEVCRGDGTGPSEAAQPRLHIRNSASVQGLGLTSLRPSQAQIWLHFCDVPGDRRRA